MDVGAVGGWSWYDDVGGGYDHEGVHAVGFEGKGEIKGKGKGRRTSERSPRTATSNPRAGIALQEWEDDEEHSPIRISSVIV